MKIDIDHVLFWMDAIRNSQDRYRTLESFWKGQIKSKIWLIEKLSKFVNKGQNSIIIYGGWNGVLASLIFQSNIEIKKIISIDIDPECEQIANTMNKIEEINGKFSAITCDMVDYIYTSNPDVVINTSCEHLSQQTYEKWLSIVPNSSIIVLQSNNYNIDEHIRCADSIDDFKKQSKISILFEDTLHLPNYDRYMLIGRKFQEMC
jgi:hypothetical protein